MIDKRGKWWKGENVDDLREFLVDFSTGNYRADDIRQSTCGNCGGTVFGLEAHGDEGCARRTCRVCGATAFICDSEEFWDDADTGECACPCGAEDFEVAVGFALIDSGEIRWIYVSCRCMACGVLGVYTDWKIDYEPSRQLLELA